MPTFIPSATYYASLFAESSGNLIFPPQSSSVAESVDNLFYLIAAIAGFFFALIVVLMVLFVVRYRRRPDRVAMPSPDHNIWLEIFWSVVPALLLVVIFTAGFTTYLDMREPPDDALELQVVARKWSWAFQYPNGVVHDDLHLPVDRPVRLLMSSEDVIHSLYVPAFRIKQDLVPGRFSQTWVRAKEEGVFPLYCAEYCGQGHSTMDARVVVHAPGEFERWMREEADKLNNLPPAELGALLYKRQGCIQCHAADPSMKANVGPAFYNVFGTQQALKSGESVVVEENYIRESILQPMAKIRAGYQPVMPTYQGRLTDKEINALIAYIKSLKN